MYMDTWTCTCMILIDAITPDLIRTTTLITFGSSGVDIMCWRCMCTSFKTSNDLCLTLSSFALRSCTSYVDPRGLSPFFASRLIMVGNIPVFSTCNYRDIQLQLLVILHLLNTNQYIVYY